MLFTNVFPKTASGKVELASPLPRQEVRRAPARRTGPLSSPYPLTLISPASDQRITSTFGGIHVRREAPPLEMHPDDARARGLATASRAGVERAWRGAAAAADHRRRAARGGVLAEGRLVPTSDNGQTVSALAPGHPRRHLRGRLLQRRAGGRGGLPLAPDARPGLPWRLALSETYFQKGFSLKAVGPVLAQNYHSGVVDRLEPGPRGAGRGHHPQARPRVRLLLRRRPGGRVRLRDPGEVPGPADLPVRRDHPQPRRQRPHRARWGSASCPRRTDPARATPRSGAGDVVILPAFGVPVEEMEHLRGKGCVLVDTTCGSVLNVWKNVHKYARDGFTAVIHGKHYHEETKATASQALTHAGGLPLRPRPAPRPRRSATSSAGRLAADGCVARFAHAASPGFDPDARPRAHRPRQPDDDAHEREPRDPGDAPRRRCASATARRSCASASAPSTPSARPPRTARTRCSRCSSEGGLDVMLVIGGYNSSNTQALARICAERLPTYHIKRPRVHRAARAIRHRPVGVQHEEATPTAGSPRAPSPWASPPGASTPNNVVGEVVERILALRGRHRGATSSEPAVPEETPGGRRCCSKARRGSSWESPTSARSPGGSPRRWRARAPASPSPTRASASRRTSASWPRASNDPLILPCDVSKDEDLEALAEAVQSELRRARLRGPCRGLRAARGAGRGVPEHLARGLSRRPGHLVLLPDRARRGGWCPSWRAGAAASSPCPTWAASAWSRTTT